MTADEFKAALAALGLSVRRAAPEFGFGLRTAYGYARGEYVIPRKVAELVAARLRLSRRRKPIRTGGHIRAGDIGAKEPQD